MLVLAQVACTEQKQAGTASTSTGGRSLPPERKLPADPYINLTREDIYALLSSDDPSDLALRVASMVTDRKNPLVCSSLRSMWNEDSDAGLPPAALENSSRPQVRIPLAATLSRCSEGETAHPEYREYVIAVLLDASAAENDRIRAASTLGIVGEERDVALLERSARQPGNERIAVGAISGLRAMRSVMADEVLAQLASAEDVEESVRAAAQRLRQR